MINETNYIVYFVDFAENQLSNADREMVLSFVERHPEKKNELQDFINASSLVLEKSSETANFDNIDLFRSEKEADDLLCVAYLENDLPATEKKLFEKKLLHDEKLKSALTLLQHTYLTPSSAQFTKKESLLQTKKIFWLPQDIAAAAILILFLGIGSYFFSNQNLKSFSGSSLSQLKTSIATPSKKITRKTTPAGIKTENTIIPATTIAIKKKKTVALRENPKTCCHKINPRSIEAIELPDIASIELQHKPISIPTEIPKPSSTKLQKEKDNTKTLKELIIDKINKSKKKKIQIEYDKTKNTIKSLKINTRFLSLNKKI